MHDKPTITGLFATFFKIGLFTIGGGYAMLAVVRQIIVVQRKWMPEDEFVELIALLQSLPGIFAVNMALSVGKRLLGRKGSLSAAFGAILPSIVIVLAIAIFAQKWKGNALVEACFKGVRPCVVALILSPALQMMKKAGVTLRNFYLPLVAVVLVCVLHVSPVYVIVAAGVGGAFYGYLKERRRAA